MNLRAPDEFFDTCKDIIMTQDFQLSIARTVSGARKGTSQELISNELNWPSLSDRREGIKLKNFFEQ